MALIKFHGCISIILMAILQHKNTLKAQIQALLILIMDLTRERQVEISRRLGYDRDVFSRLKTDENYCGSKQLLAGMNLLLELETIKRQPPVKTPEQEIRELKARLNAFERHLGTTIYPEHTPQGSALNEPVNSEREDSARVEQAAEDITKAAFDEPSGGQPAKPSPNDSPPRPDRGRKGPRKQRR